MPTIHFGTTTSHLLEAMARCGSDVISVDWRLPLDEAWRRIGDRGIQGNLDPGVMLAPFEVVAREARQILARQAGGRATSSTSATACSPTRRATTSGASPNWSTRRPPGPDREAPGPASTLGVMAQLGVVLATFGSAVTAEDVPAYLASVRGGREVPADLIEEFRRRYDLIGRSPLIDITQAQCAALQALLDSDEPRRTTRACVAGMLHSEPSLTGALDALAADGTRRIVVVALAPQYSPIILAGYERTVAAWRAEHPDVDVHIAGAWHLIPEWIDALAERVEEALARPRARRSATGSRSSSPPTASPARSSTAIPATSPSCATPPRRSRPGSVSTTTAGASRTRAPGTRPRNG